MFKEVDNSLAATMKSDKSNDMTFAVAEEAKAEIVMDEEKITKTPSVSRRDVDNVGS